MFKASKIAAPGFRRSSVGAALLLAGLLAQGALMAAPNNPRAPTRLAPSAAPAGPLTVTGEQVTSPDEDCTSVTVHITGDVLGQVDDGGGNDAVLFELWDDGEQKDTETVLIPVGQTQTVNVTLSFTGQYKTGAPGVGVYSYELGLLDDPFIPTDVAGTCGGREIKGGVKNIKHHPVRVVCQNRTTGQKVTLATPAFNCTAAGLVSSPNDKILIHIEGVAK